MWQRFTERARRVILLGQEEAGRMNSAVVDTEHLLVGVVRENEGAGSQILQQMGITLQRVREEIGESDAEGETSATEPKLTPEAKRVLELAADEARRMRHNYIGTEHLLLGLLRQREGFAAQILRKIGADLESARVSVLSYLGAETEEKKVSSYDVTRQEQLMEVAKILSTQRERREKQLQQLRTLTADSTTITPELQRLLTLATAHAIASGQEFTDVADVMLALMDKQVSPLPELLNVTGADVEAIMATLRVYRERMIPPPELMEAKEALIQLYVQKRAALQINAYEVAANIQEKMNLQEERIRSLQEAWQQSEPEQQTSSPTSPPEAQQEAQQQ